RLDARAPADHDVVADDRVGADVRVGMDLGLGRNDGSFVDQERFPATIVICASAASRPSTSARQSKRQRLVRLAVSSTLRRSWSPGRTGLLKRAFSTPAR